MKNLAFVLLGAFLSAVVLVHGNVEVSAAAEGDVDSQTAGSSAFVPQTLDIPVAPEQTFAPQTLDVPISQEQIFPPQTLDIPVAPEQTFVPQTLDLPVFPLDESFTGPQPRVTCDILGGKFNHAACAAHCILKGYKGGWCDSKAVCNCRR